ncbi:hypothetical protein TeGR_g4832, partial [Tetraparma gracilis]
MGAGASTTVDEDVKSVPATASNIAAAAALPADASNLEDLGAA